MTWPGLPAACLGFSFCSFTPFNAGNSIHIELTQIQAWSKQMCLFCLIELRKYHSSFPPHPPPTPGISFNFSMPGTICTVQSTSDFSQIISTPFPAPSSYSSHFSFPGLSSYTLPIPASMFYIF